MNQSTVEKAKKGMGLQKSGAYHIGKEYADSLFLFLNALETDNSSYFYPPERIGSGYLFRGDLVDSIIVNRHFKKKRY